MSARSIVACVVCFACGACSADSGGAEGPTTTGAGGELGASGNGGAAAAGHAGVSGGGHGPEGGHATMGGGGNATAGGGHSGGGTAQGGSSGGVAGSGGAMAGGGAIGASGSGGESGGGGETTSRVRGVTVDDIAALPQIIDSLAKLPKRPTTRIVFDEGEQADYYADAAHQIHAVSDVMGEIVDSQFVTMFSLDEYKSRTTAYLSALGADVDMWEVGNEINGEWVGTTPDVVAKMTGAYEIVHAQGKRTALTLYYNQDCWSQPDHEMFTWATANVPGEMKQGLDWVLVSYYQDDCNNLVADWEMIFEKLGAIFPSAKLGIGEFGPMVASEKAPFVTEHYTRLLANPRFIGGNFYWYFAEDMVPASQPLWTTLRDAIAAGP